VAAKTAGIPVIINTIHGFYFSDDTSKLKRKLFIFAERLAAKCSTLIFSQNREDMDTAIKENICRPEKIKYLGNGINLEKFNPKNFNKNDCIEQAKQFSTQKFMLNFKQEIDFLWQQHQTTI
jgi:hypothetical protein